MPHNHLNLLTNDVHIWRASLEQPAGLVQKLVDTLSEDEQNRANRFYFERDKKHFITSRGLLRETLSRYLDVEPKQLQFVYNPCGKPALASKFNTVQFNLSHSEGMVLYAFTRDRQIGVDLEYIRPIPDFEQLIQRFFSLGEAEAIASQPASEQLVAFFQIWTCKEAYLKATGEGLAQLQQAEVCLAPGESYYQLLNNAPWSLQTLNPAPNYTAALVVEGNDWNLTNWQCDFNL